MKTKKKVCIIGHFGGNKNFVDGQTVKTKSINQELEKIVGKDNIYAVDTYGGLRNLPKIFLDTYKYSKISNHVFILPAQNSVKILPPYLFFLSNFNHTKLQYIVIGGWLPKFLKHRKFLSFILRKFQNIYVETSNMKTELENMNFSNIKVLPNGKNLTPLKESDLNCIHEGPFRICMMSRVTEKKGIIDAIEVLKKINHNEINYFLDIYGPIDEEFKESFFEAINQNSSFVSYKGIVPYDKTTNVLKNYFFLLFPTKFYTEGIPGTIIDAYSAGLPVISSKWENFSDIVDDGKTGYGYSFANHEELLQILKDILNDSSSIDNLKVNCLQKYEEFRISNIIRNNIEI